MSESFQPDMSEAKQPERSIPELASEQAKALAVEEGITDQAAIEHLAQVIVEREIAGGMKDLHQGNIDAIDARHAPDSELYGGSIPEDVKNARKSAEVSVKGQSSTELSYEQELRQLLREYAAREKNEPAA